VIGSVHMRTHCVILQYLHKVFITISAHIQMLIMNIFHKKRKKGLQYHSVHIYICVHLSTK
jgi:hypothetical protein